MSDPHDYKLVVLAEALQEIVEQADFYARESGSPLAALWDAAVEATTLSLLTMPNRGKPAHLIARNLRGIRCVPVRGFDQLSVFYRVHEPDRIVTVVGVLHMARDIARILATPRGER